MCIFIFSAKINNSQHNSNDIHRFPAINKIPGLSLAKLIPQLSTSVGTVLEHVTNVLT